MGYNQSIYIKGHNRGEVGNYYVIVSTLHMYVYNHTDIWIIKMYHILISMDLLSTLGNVKSIIEVI